MESRSYGRFRGIISSVFVPAKFLYSCCLLGIVTATIGLDCQRDFVRDIFCCHVMESRLWPPSRYYIKTSL